MPRRKEISEILEIMKDAQNIRNIGLVGHIDHGKTTLSDSLLAEAGLLSPELVGEARALDYLEEEQKRGITMKTANISLYYEKTLEGRMPFLINLVDTPGHLDFSGKVTRALRLIDGVVVVVDAVEEIVSQSETVVRQALQEDVKPVLFINKVDRLIKELKLTDEQIKEKFSRIIKDFNTLVERYADPPFNQEWKVSPTNGTVVIGSALHKWGYNSKILANSLIKFKDIRLRYETDTYTKEMHDDLAVYLPVFKAILEMVVDHIPNPIEAQKYRIRKIWDGDINSNIGYSLVNCDPDGPLIICLSKVQVDKYGLIATGRLFSGSCSKKKEVFLLRENSYETIQRTAIFMGQRREQVERIPVGNIIAIEGFKKVKSGETIVEKSFADNMIPFGSVKYVSTPVITVSISPDLLSKLDQMEKLINDLLIEDPNLMFEIDKENGEYLLSGMGPLHLEVTINELKKRGVEVSMSEPRAVFKESCKKKSSLIMTKSINSETNLELKIERLDNRTLKFFLSHDYRTFKPLDKLKKALEQNTNLSNDEIENFWNCDNNQNILIYKGKSELNDFFKDLIIEIIEKIQLNGPLCGEKLTEIKITIEDLNLSSLNEANAFTELSVLFYDAIKRGLNEAELILLEPIYNTAIQLPPKYVKDVISLLAKYSTKIKDINQEKDYQTIIEVLLPVRHSIKFAEEIRSLTSGRAFWQNELYDFFEVPQNESNKLIQELKFLKGLSW